MTLNLGGSQPAAASRSARWQLGFLCLFLTPFFGGGLFFLVAGWKTLVEGRTKEGVLVAAFALAFLAVPSLVLALAVRGMKRRARALRERETRPDQPWLWREDWASGRLKSRDAAAAGLFWFMALMFIGVSLPAVLGIPRELEKGNQPILLALVFPLAGVGLGVAAARATIRRRKFGVSELELHTVPGVIGGTFSGAVTIPAKVRAEGGFQVRLACIRRTTSGSGKNRSTHERVLWEEHKTLVREFMEHDRAQTGLPVFFSIPSDQPESEDGNPAIVWRLEVTAAVPGVDYAAQFEVPMFRTADSRSGAAKDGDPTRVFQMPEEAWTPPADSRIRVGTTERGETEFYFPPARNLAVGLFLLAFTAVWTVALVVLLKKAPLIFGVGWGVFDLLLMGFLFQLLFHSVRVVAGHGELAIHHRFLFFCARNKVPAGEVAEIALRGGMQSGNKLYYDLKVLTKAGKTLSAGSHIADKHHAEWLARQLRKALGLP